MPTNSVTVPADESYVEALPSSSSSMLMVVGGNIKCHFGAVAPGKGTDVFFPAFEGDVIQGRTEKLWVATLQSTGSTIKAIAVT